jgi:alpha-1,2-mannosyltransferase
MYNMKANVIHGDFNPCGGAERVSLITIYALFQMGIDNVDLTTLTSPNISKLENTFGKKIVSVLKRITKINVIDLLEELEKAQANENVENYHYDLTINTNGDAAPYYHPSFSKCNTITYCHFPTTKYHIDSENSVYLETDLAMTETSNNSFSETKYHREIDKSNNSKVTIQFRGKKECFEIIKYGYWNLLRNSTLITNSQFSRREIINSLGLNYKNNDDKSNIHILSPPVDVETFRNVASTNAGHDRSSDTVLVITRIDPHKKIENAIKLAKILKDNKTGRAMKIVGNLYHWYYDYYPKLEQMVINLGLTDYITFEINASLDKLLSIMRESRVYFHPMVGEHFGISVIEAMAAGLIPIVPTEGGLTEFVPKEYQFNTIEHAAKIIGFIFNNLSKPNRITLREDHINKFSSSNYIESFHGILNKLLSKKNDVYMIK